ncbi:hypothetical protein U1Q18_037945 [Sarracenia purpurea var. burkii]
MEGFTEPRAAREAHRGGARERRWRPTMDGMVSSEVDARWWPKQRRRRSRVSSEVESELVNGADGKGMPSVWVRAGAVV